jgi:hypothetical protein
MTGFFALVLSTSCKKAIEKKVEEKIMGAITTGEWIVEQYKEGENNLSNLFLNYYFKFNSDGTLTGTVNGAATDGTWDPNTTDFTIFTDFPTAVDPLKKLGLCKSRNENRQWNQVADLTQKIKPAYDSQRSKSNFRIIS